MGLTNIERRVLAHLPDWAADEAWHVENEGGPEVSVRSYSLPAFAVRLAQDVNTQVEGRPLTEGECLQTLQVLASRGFAESFDKALAVGTEIASVEQHWRMTEAGFEALIGPAQEPDQVPGPVQVPVQPASVESGAVA
jgi:hypothetical protein